ALSTDRVSLDEYMGVWFRSKVSEAVELRSMGISFHTKLYEKSARRCLVIEQVGATFGWLMRLNRYQEDDVSLLGLLDTFVHRMYEIVRKREKDLANASLKMQACKCKLQILDCKCLLKMQAAYAGCKCLLVNACLQMLAANASCMLQMLQILACKCLVANAKASCKFKVQILDENAGYKCFTEYIIS
ncbi:hypothetical protein Tco_1451569, partial [Tanacetum coccineum]